MLVRSRIPKVWAAAPGGDMKAPHVGQESLTFKEFLSPLKFGNSWVRLRQDPTEVTNQLHLLSASFFIILVT